MHPTAASDSEHQIDHVRERSSQPAAAPITGGWPRRRLLRPTLLPGLAASRVWPRAARRRSASRTAPRSGAGYALTFDDGPHPQGTPAVLEMLARQRRPRDLLPGRRAGPAQPRAGRGDRRRGHDDRPALRPPPQPAAPHAPAGPRGPGPRRGRDRPQRRTAADALPPALRGAQRGRPGTRPPRGWRTLLWSRWGRDWRATPPPSRSPARVTRGAGAGSVLLLHDADDYSAPGSWRRTAAALPRVLEQLRRRGLAPGPR